MPVGMDIPGATRTASSEWDADQLVRPFLEAAEEGDAGALSRLLRQGAEINAREEPNLSQRYSMGWTAGKTALIKAAQQGHIECVRILLASGADRECRDDDYWTALHWAANNGHAAVVKLLLDGGAKPGPKDHEKRTPLVYAAIRGHPEVVKLLLDAGAHAASLDRFGKSALSLALEHGHSAAARLLAEHAERSRHGAASPPADPDAVSDLQCERDEARQRAAELEAKCRELERELAALRARAAAA